MTSILYFLGQLALTLTVCLALSALLRRSLRPLLMDLCGTAERAHFWTTFSQTLLVIFPAIFGLGFHPESADPAGLFFELAGQLRWNLFGFTLALTAIGAALAFFALVAPRPQVQGEK
ncbi:MAG: hypothetical protein CO094_12995 [Anaerolineae bacterium CG_4_9_14_3_um_filter_57_17]|nr:hypothetical protein [bacterium]NCT21250.1 hypothetical protein [bacterium]OIO86465.1 MAG: hypothetical protein AUK01_03015 [Anaerolineae bacterium CG2_30_57_67]PJB64446.1 MAG: hypothetical protein CO094_12995 [Anaerolineae bacterium CG_4_9_14_3_um_filter_57_17]